MPDHASSPKRSSSADPLAAALTGQQTDLPSLEELEFNAARWLPSGEVRRTR